MRLTSFILIFIMLHFALLANSQEGKIRPIDIKRVKLNEDIDQLQKAILLQANSTFKKNVRESEETYWYSKGVDSLQSVLESDSTLDHRLKVKYLTGLIIIMQEYYKVSALKQSPDDNGIKYFKAYNDAVEADRHGFSLLDLANRNSYEINSAIFGKNTVFFDDPMIDEINFQVYRQFAQLFPEKVLSTLTPYLDFPLADTLIIKSAKEFPSQFYDYASAANSPLGKKISTVKDSAVQLLYKIAQEKSGRLLFPFYPLLLSKQLEYEKIKESISKEARYFSMLVNARIKVEKEPFGLKDTLFKKEMDRMINYKAQAAFIDQINASHEFNDDDRFSIINPLSPDEIYFLIISGENLLYTSSYIGLFNRMINKSAGKRGDSILIRVGHLHFRKFLKMAASFNKLNSFLTSMPDSIAFSLIKKFTYGLEQADDIADAVDVADAYASVSDSVLKLQIRNQVEASLKETRETENIRGERIYSLLSLLFDSSGNLQNALDRTYHLSSVFNVAYHDVADISGKVVEQVFFYGDKDSRESYENFMSGFRDKVAWKIVEKEYWVEIRSLIGKSIWIFANLPLSTSEESEKYLKAQYALKDHLDSLRISPTVVVHRGHSYFLKQTLAQFPSIAKIVLVGSCGGYQLLSAMLDKCPNAHIISTKEVGTKTINDPILQSMNESLRKGLDINWIDFWNNLELQFSSKVDKLRFENYIPPHKNLGAIFIKAYSSIIADTVGMN